MVLLTKDTHIVFTFSDACYCIMDTLKGEWIWIKSAGGLLHQIKDSTFTSILKILSQNADSSINYEVWAADTLFSQGSWQTKYYPPHEAFIIDIKLPFYWYKSTYPDGQNWRMHYFYGNGPNTDPFLGFYLHNSWDSATFFYQKIK